VELFFFSCFSHTRQQIDQIFIFNGKCYCCIST